MNKQLNLKIPKKKKFLLTINLLCKGTKSLLDYIKADPVHFVVS